MCLLRSNFFKGRAPEATRKITYEALQTYSETLTLTPQLRYRRKALQMLQVRKEIRSKVSFAIVLRIPPMSDLYSTSTATSSLAISKRIRMVQLYKRHWRARLAGARQERRLYIASTTDEMTPLFQAIQSLGISMTRIRSGLVLARSDTRLNRI